MDALSTSTFSPIGNWQKSLSAQKPAKPASDDDMTPVFMEMLQSSVSNGLSGGDPMQAMQAMQGLAEAHMRSKESKSLSNIETAIKANSRLLAASLPGKVGQFFGNNFSVGAGPKQTPAYEVPKDVHLKDVHIRLFNKQNGQLISVTNGPTRTGIHSLDQMLKNLPQGNYQIEVSGSDCKGQHVALSTLVSGPIQNVLFNEKDIQVGWNGSMHDLDQLKALYPQSKKSAAHKVAPQIAQNN